MLAATVSCQIEVPFAWQRIDIGTFFFGKQRQRRLRIAIHLPISAELAACRHRAENPAHRRRIAQNRPISCGNCPDCARRRLSCNRQPCTEALRSRKRGECCGCPVGQIALQAVRPANIHQRPPAGYAQQPYAHALFAQPLVQGRRLLRKRMIGGIAHGKQVGGFQPCQGGCWHGGPAWLQAGACPTMILQQAVQRRAEAEWVLATGCGSFRLAHGGNDHLVGRRYW